MDFTNILFTNNPNSSKDVDKILEGHFENIEKGVFDPTSFCADLQSMPSGDVDYRKCVQSIMRLTKERVSGTANYKMVHNLEKMMEILLENFTAKKSGVCEVLFFPSVENEARIIEYLRAATKSIYVCMFAICNERLCTALLEAHLRGVNVRLITDDVELKILGSNVKDLTDEGVSVRTDASTQSLMHNKFVIIDQKILMTGSYNWTARATKANQENVVIIENSFLIEKFTVEFNKLWKMFRPQNMMPSEGRVKKNTKLYQKYQDAIKKRERELEKIVIKGSDEEEHVLNPDRLDVKSKKISKFKRATNKPAPKSSKKSKKILEDTQETEHKSDMAKAFLKIVMTLFYLFSLVVFSQKNLGGMNVPMSMEIEKFL